MKRIRFTWIAYAIMICSLTTFAQPDTLWTRTYGINAYPHVFETDDGGVASILSENPVFGLRILKLAADGDSLWSTTYCDSGYYVNGAARLLNGNFVVLTDTITGNDGRSDLPDRVFILNPEGGVVMSQAGVDSVNFDVVSATPDGGAVVIGKDGRGNNTDLMVQKVNSNFVTEWITTFGDSVFDEQVSEADADEQGRVFFVGNSQNETVGIYESFAGLIGSTGQLLWLNRYASQHGLSTGFWDCKAEDGEYWAAGIYDEGPFNEYPWIVKYNLNGDSTWNRTIHPSLPLTILVFRDFDIISGGDAIFIGGLQASNYYSPVLYRMTGQGDISWDFGQQSAPEVVDGTWSIVRLRDNGYLVCGSFIPNQGLHFTRFAPDIVSTSPTGELPSSIVLHANYPNPFNATTEITFDLPRALQTSLKVYDVLGREVAELAGGMMNAGSHTILYDASGLSSGVYFYRLEAGEFGETRKMVFLK
ncbi:T9SS type A sorting domain-containing protein [bacterium]|nr:T9SS type A sorting domain-containing protein [bacterium]